MNAWKEIAMPLLVSALTFVAILHFTGELHLSSKALEFFAILWVVQAAMALLQKKRHSQSEPSVDTVTADEHAAI